MKTILVTGAQGFIGKNLVEALGRSENLKIRGFDIEDDIPTLQSYLSESNMIFHLAGINRPQKIEEFVTGNINFTQTIVDILEKLKKPTPIVFTSSIQAALENPYGVSKKKAEKILIEYSKRNRAKIFIYRLHNVFGKWCRPNYNSVVATFCHNIANDLDIFISDENEEIELVYIDDVVEEFSRLVESGLDKLEKIHYEIKKTYRITLGKLADALFSFKKTRKTLRIPDVSDDFGKALYATYLSYLSKNDFSYRLEKKIDERGSLVEILKSEGFGQIFISTSHQGITRGNHYHNTKIEKFCVIQGDAEIKLRHIFKDDVISYRVSGNSVEVVDIPPGYTHNIKNIGEGELIVLFWSSEVFDPNKPDTYYQEV